LKKAIRSDLPLARQAHAKISLFLEVEGRLENGYHTLLSVTQELALCDTVTLIPRDEPGFVARCDHPAVPEDDSNLVCRAARRFYEAVGMDATKENGWTIRVEKRIPVAAGMAGGSADAAAAIRMMNRMLRLNLSMEEMIETGREVGADVPFCIMNKPALVEGIGEKIMPFKCSPDFDILLVKPRKGVSTKEAFDIVDSSENEHPDCMMLMNALIMNDYEGVVSSLGNSLEPAAIQLVKDIRTVKNRLNEMGFDGVLMSGSGSTVFGITRNAQLLNDSMEQLRQEKYFVRKTRIYTGE
jgi:4-diphosphocytidyl-2-C-methyl-D-erythritol kinase